MLHIRPEAHLAGELLPDFLVAPHRLATLFDEGLHAVSLDFLLALNADFLLDLELDRKAVCIPACLSRDILSLHGAIARNHILDNAGLNVADVRSAVCGRRSVVEHIGPAALALLDGLLKDAVLCPELLNLALARHKVHIRGDFSVHFFLLLSQKRKRPPLSGRTLSAFAVPPVFCFPP